MRHTVVISDVHLCEVEPTNGLWMRYRQRPYMPTAELARMLDALRAKVDPGTLVLVLGGDVFDFDAPRVVDNESVFHDLARTAENAVASLRAMLEDHLEFVDALGRVLGDGHELVFIAGNHDVQLAMPEVRAMLTDRLAEAAARTGRPEAASAASRVTHRAWFYLGEDGVLVEHGHLYDRFCTYRYPMAPWHRGDPREVQPTMGSLATRRLISRMGYMNPHVDSTFMLTPLGYVMHWARHYALTKRQILFSWAWGGVRSILELVLRRDPGTEARRRENLRLAALETGLPLKRLAKHARLYQAPVEDELPRAMRELWVDRLLFGLFTLALAAVPLFALTGWAKLAALASAIPFAIYELRVPKISLDETWNYLRKTTRRIAKIHGARAIVFGHTHGAEGAWEGDVFYGNSGSWSAAFKDLECKQPLTEDRPVLWLTSVASGAISGGLFSWRDGAFERTDSVREAPAAATASLATDVFDEISHVRLGAAAKAPRSARGAIRGARAELAAIASLAKLHVEGEGAPRSAPPPAMTG